MKLCIDCAEEIPEDRLRLAQGTMRCVSCQEIHEIGWYEKQIRQSELKSKNLGNSKEKNLRTKPTQSQIKFYTCISCNYKKNQFVDRPCAWCGESGQILDQSQPPNLSSLASEHPEKKIQNFTLTN